MTKCAQELEMAKKKQKKRSIWVHEILKKRKIEGEYATLCKTLEDHEDIFFKYFRNFSLMFYF